MLDSSLERLRCSRMTTGSGCRLISSFRTCKGVKVEVQRWVRSHQMIGPAMHIPNARFGTEQDQGYMFGQTGQTTCEPTSACVSAAGEQNRTVASKQALCCTVASKTILANETQPSPDSGSQKVCPIDENKAGSEKL